MSDSTGAETAPESARSEPKAALAALHRPVFLFITSVLKTRNHASLCVERGDINGRPVRNAREHTFDKSIGSRDRCTPSHSPSDLDPHRPHRPAEVSDKE